MQTGYSRNFNLAWPISTGTEPVRLIALKVYFHEVGKGKYALPGLRNFATLSKQLKITQAKNSAQTWGMGWA